MTVVGKLAIQLTVERLNDKINH